MIEGYIDLRGHQVYSYQWPAQGEAVLLLHGGLSQTDSFDFTVRPALSEEFNVFGYDRTAHGRTADRDGSMHFEFQCDEAIAYLEDIVNEPAHLIGYSDGAIISLLVALKRPDLVKSIVSFGGNFHFSGTLPMPEWDGVISPLDQAEYNAISPDAPETLAAKMKKMFAIWKSEPNLTVEDLKKIKCPVLVIAGDDDVINHHHTIELYEALPQGRLAIIPAASHKAHKEQPSIFQAHIRDFLSDLSYPQTEIPIRRLK
jgi:pimeloyl-ACP methyl ester carboxylesterase